MNGLAPQTTEVFERITRLTCIQPFVLVGGTALSLQLNKRQSEDLDFMCWKKSSKDKSEVPISAIKQEIESVCKIDSMEIGGFNFVEFVVEGVKLSFYAAPRKRIPSMQIIPFKNNLQLADIKSVGAMKMEAMLRRSKFRDYYDIYTILKEGVDIQEMIEMAFRIWPWWGKDSYKRLKKLLCMNALRQQISYIEETKIWYYVYDKPSSAAKKFSSLSASNKGNNHRYSNSHYGL